jgi:hypothetical protein
MHQTMRMAFSRFAHDHSVYIVHRKRGLPASYSTASWLRIMPRCCAQLRQTAKRHT